MTRQGSPDLARRRSLAALVVAACGGVAAPAWAGPVLDRLRARRAGSTGTAQAGHVLHDVRYGPHATQTMDVYLPDAVPAPAQDAPVIFMVHGGAWKIGDKTMSRVVDAKAARWVKRGFVLVSINYRMLPEAKPDQQLADVALALATAQSQAREWGADPSRFILMGHSAGAHLVALLAVTPPQRFSPAFQPVLGTVSLDSAAMDVSAIMSKPHMRLYDEPFGTDPAYWRAMSPTQLIGQGTAPLLAVCSSRRDDSCAQAQGLIDRARAVNVRAAVLPQDLSHGDINAQLGLESGYTRAVEDFMASLDGRVARLLGVPH